MGHWVRMWAAVLTVLLGRPTLWIWQADLCQGDSAEGEVGRRSRVRAFRRQMWVAMMGLVSESCLLVSFSLLPLPHLMPPACVLRDLERVHAWVYLRPWRHPHHLLSLPRSLTWVLVVSSSPFHLVLRSSLCQRTCRLLVAALTMCLSCSARVFGVLVLRSHHHPRLLHLTYPTTRYLPLVVMRGLSVGAILPLLLFSDPLQKEYALLSARHRSAQLRRIECSAVAGDPSYNTDSVRAQEAHSLQSGYPQSHSA